ncbi:S8 family serine peptidase [Akkermansiaceae bacterium]|nr:S8 family serine peptidase [Akkermansiaceae bacterium]
MKIFRSFLILSSLAIGGLSAQGGLSTIGRVFEFKRAGQPYYLQLSSTEVANVVADSTNLDVIDLSYQMYPQPTLIGVIEPITAQVQYVNGLPPGGLEGIEDFFTEGAGAFTAFYNAGLNAPLTPGSIILDPGVAPSADFPSLVFYPVGASRDETKRHVLRSSYVVKLKPNFAPQAAQFIARQGIEVFTNLYPDQGILLCEAAHSYEALQRIFSVAQDTAVESVEPLFIREVFERLVPADPFYAYEPTNIGYQWGLNNTGQNQGLAGVDIRLEGALDLTNDGDDFVPLVMIVDDGVFFDNPNLTLGLPTLGRDFNGGGAGESINPADTHGTQMAGIISATRDGEGITGVSQANFASLRLTAAPVDDFLIASALDYDEENFRAFRAVSVNGWGPRDDETDLVGVSALIQAAIQKETAAENGTIYVWAAGNGAEIGDNANYDGFANLPETITVGAITDQGRRAFYSEKGSNLVISGPSSGGAQDVLTTSADAAAINGLTNDFGGTSAASATVAGVVALMLDINPLLTWRDVQEILIETATQNDPNGGDWITNGAGFTFNHSYGAGLVNAEAAVVAAQARGANVLAERGAPLTMNQTPIATVPDANGDSYLLNFDLSQQPNRRVEHVQLRALISTERRADLDIVLVSPNGTQSVLAESHSDSDEVGITNWVFSSVRCWGEGSQGVWVLRITDKTSGNVAVLNNAQLVIHGVDDPAAPVQPSPLLVSDQVIEAVQGNQVFYTFEVLGVDSISIDQLPLGLSFGSNRITGSPVTPGIFVANVTLTGPSGTRVFPLTFIISPVALSLGEAVEQDNRTTTSGGDLPWNFEFGDTFDGVDAVVSARDLPANSESTFGFTNLPERIMVSYWKVSSQDGADRLFLHNGNSLLPQQWYAFIDGRRLTWNPIAVRLPAQSNKVDWTFTRDEDDVDVDGNDQDPGSSQGFVDQVRLIDIKSFEADVIAAANVINFEFEQTGKTLFLPVEDPDASGGMAIRSSAVGDGQTVGLAGWVDGPAQVTFDFRTDTTLGDGMEYLVGGVVRNGVLANPVVGVGTQGWTNVTDQLPEGRHYVQIRFRKDFSGESIGDDAIWLDNIAVTQQSTFLSWSDQLNQDSNPNEDSDRDGYSNLMEYAFAGDPSVADVPRYAPRVVSAFGTSWIEFGLDASKADLDFEAQESTDLEAWVSSSAYPDREEGNYRIYRIPIFSDPSSPKRFYRVEVTEK